jgi:hypothetical protein
MIRELLDVERNEQTGSIAIATAAIAAATPAAATAAAATAVAAAATAAATAAVAATTTTTAESATATAAAAFFARLGFVDGQSATVHVLAVHGCNSSCSFVIRTHFNEAEALASTGVTVTDHLSRHDLAVGLEHFLKFRTIDRVREIPDVQTLAHVGLRTNIPRSCGSSWGES